MQALKALSLGNQAESLIRTLDFAQKYTQLIDWHTFAGCKRMLESTNAFKNPNDTDLLGVKLILPT